MIFRYAGMLPALQSAIVRHYITGTSCGSDDWVADAC